MKRLTPALRSPSPSVIELVPFRPIPYVLFGKLMTMTAAADPQLEPGRVYRTREFGRWSANAPRLAKRLVRDGKLVPLAHGLYGCPRRSRFGLVPPTDEEFMRAFLEGGPFIFTGPDRWNALGLGTTTVFAMPVVYNAKRSGVFDLGGRRFLLRRVAFPDHPVPEWFVIDVFEHAHQAGTSQEALTDALARRVREGAFEVEALRMMAERFGTRRTRAAVETAIGKAAS